MTRSDLVLALLATADGRAFSPAQIQKTAFLVAENLPQLFDDGQAFHFVPYDYGPFDKNVYIEAAALEAAGMANIARNGRWCTYAATDEGVRRGHELLSGLPQSWAQYLRDISAWARAQSFSALVKSIYEAYPAMKANSIFRDPA